MPITTHPPLFFFASASGYSWVAIGLLLGYSWVTCIEIAFKGGKIPPFCESRPVTRLFSYSVVQFVFTIGVYHYFLNVCYQLLIIYILYIIIRG